MLEKIPRGVASWFLPYLVSNPSHARVDVDGLAYPLHHSTTCSHQTRGQGSLPGAVLSRHVAVDGGALLGM
jgi:hypothetical protein